MARSLVIVESPAKAKTINKYLGRNYSVKASYGHVMDLPKKTIGILLPEQQDGAVDLLADTMAAEGIGSRDGGDGHAKRGGRHNRYGDEHECGPQAQTSATSNGVHGDLPILLRRPLLRRSTQTVVQRK